MDDIETQTPLYCVETKDIKKWIISKAKNQHSRLLNLLVAEWSTKNALFLNSFHSFELQLTKTPETIEELCEIRLNYKEIEIKLSEIQKEVAQNNEVLKGLLLVFDPLMLLCFSRLLSYSMITRCSSKMRWLTTTGKFNSGLRKSRRSCKKHNIHSMNGKGNWRMIYKQTSAIWSKELNPVRSALTLHQPKQISIPLFDS